MTRALLVIFVWLSTASAAVAQAATVLPHAADSPWWLSGQANVILQWHGPFPSPYMGENSLRPQAEHAMSRLLTLFTGVALRPGTEVLFDVESAGGAGISDALGLAGFTNLDVVRNPTLGGSRAVRESGERGRHLPERKLARPTIPGRPRSPRGCLFGGSSSAPGNGVWRIGST